MTFHIITLFPEVLKPYLTESVVGKAQKRGIVKVKYYDLRKFSKDKKRFQVDDKPYGGGPGMVLGANPIIKALEKALRHQTKKRNKILLMSASGKEFNNKEARRLSRYDNVVIIAGRYEGVDERVKKIFRMEEVSVGPYVLTGGEVPAMAVVDAITRQTKGALGKEESIEENRLGVGVPVYTRPEVIEYKNKKYRVPKALTSGNHAEIEKWRKAHRKRAK